MQRFEFEIICRWVAARLRRRGVEIDESDPVFMDLVASMGLVSVSEAVQLGDGAIKRIAGQLSYGMYTERKGTAWSQKSARLSWARCSLEESGLSY